MAKPQLQQSEEIVEGAKSSYDRWVEREGIPVIKSFFVEDIRKVPLEPWDRKGGNGSFMQMEGAGQVNNCYICEIPPGKSLKPHGTRGRSSPPRSILGINYTMAAAASRRAISPSPPRRR